MTHRLRLTIFFIFSLLSLCIQAQNTKENLGQEKKATLDRQKEISATDTLFSSQSNTQRDTIQATQRTLSPSIVLDFGKILTLPIDFETKFEVGVELLIKETIIFIVETGYAKLENKQAFANGDYSSEGTYVKYGLGYYSQPYPDNKLGLSLRYVTSSFDEDRVTTLVSSSDTQPNFVTNVTKNALSASWTEAVLYTDQTLTSLITIGLDIRLRFLIAYDAFHPIDIYAIPGYGPVVNKSLPALRLFLKFTL